MTRKLKDIHVPDSYKHMLTRKNGTLDDYKPYIRRHIERHPGEIISNQDFVEAAGITTATAYVARLMKSGYITRRRINVAGTKSWGYTYTWHDEPLNRDIAKLQNGGVVTKKIDLPQTSLTDTVMQEINCVFLEFIEAQTDGSYAIGATQFRKQLRETKERIETERNKKLEALNDNSTNHNLSIAGVHTQPTEG